MNRFLLDTNIIANIITGEEDEIHRDVLAIITDSSNICETSAVCMIELAHLLRRGKIHLKREWNSKDVLQLITEVLNIRVIPFGEKPIKVMISLDTDPGHNDPDDFAIIAHAIADRYTLISSDSKFKYYTDQGLKFIYNKR